MKKSVLFLLVMGANWLQMQQASAHWHEGYVVEVAPAPVVVVNPAPTVVVAPTAVVEVQSAPPADVEEVMTACPGDDYVWSKGYWSWNGSWVWTKGYWNRRPHPGAVWVGGYWGPHPHHHGHYVYTAGYWR